MSGTRPYDVAVVGAGLIGLAAAMEALGRHPGLRVVVLEKDDRPASQQSGHNSGVIHSGIYYKPGSFKARFSVEGRETMLRFCAENGIPTEACGKLIVATRKEEIPRLRTLLERGRANGVPGLQRVGPERAREIEPHVQALEALWAPGTAIVDFTKVAQVYANRVADAGGEVLCDTRLVSVVRSREALLHLETTRGEMAARVLVNCAGLHADVVARMAGVRPDVRIIPFRGEYYTLARSREDLVRGLIYPVPDPAFPFLGVHFTRTMKGIVEAGPSAVLATKREGYGKGDFAVSDVAGMLAFPGFWRLAAREWKTGLAEVHRSLRKSVFVRSLQALIPEITSDDLAPGGAGVRAQAVARDGRLLDDFHIVRDGDSGNAVHVLNAPSPGATSSLVIGRHIADVVDGMLPA